ncbi:MAG: polysaccharide deacetylase family protein [Deltaproteobacteria bacterium]|nr:polysaccharide deacetylase family protein [Deltaproteobacteria bacterium]
MKKNFASRTAPLAIACLGILALSPACAVSARVPVAITIDDVPWVGPLAHGDSAVAATKRLLEKLRAHKATATAFVVCDRFVDKKTGSARRDEIMRLWTNAGHALGNHSARHKSLDGVTPEAWLDDVRRCDDALRPFAPSRHFRFPYLRQGKTPERRESARAGLAALDLKTAHVTIDIADWVLAAAYVAAKNRGDTDEQHAIVSAYVEYVVAAARRYRNMARTKVGRDIAHVALFHANALNADHFDKILAALGREGFSFVTLDRALADPVYAERDDYVGPIGLSWLYRIAPVSAKDWAWDEAQEAALSQRFPGSSSSTRTGVRINDELAARPLAPNVWVVTHERPTPSNSLVVRVADGTLVLVSTPFDAVATRAVIAWLKKTFPGAPVVAINSHHHFDGSGGNEALVAAGIPVYASDATAQLLSERGESMRRTIERLRPLDAAWIIPGHGLKFSRDLLDNTVRVVDKARLKQQ